MAPAAPALPLTDEDSWQALRWLPAIPGARAAAMGGAGVALSDDPGAARANPARLAAVTFPSVLFESRVGSWDDASLGEYEPLDPSINPVAATSVDFRTSADSSFQVGFLGYAHPLSLLGRPLVISASYAHTLDLQAEGASTTLTTPLSALPTPGAGDEVARYSEGKVDLEIDIWSAAAGWRLTPTFSAGLALQLEQMSLSAGSDGYLSDPLQFTGPGMSDPTFATYSPELLLETASSGTDTRVAYSFGAWWKPHPSLGLGSVYRAGSRFEVDGETIDHVTGAVTRFTHVVSTPDAATVGLAWRPLLGSASVMAQSLTVVLDLERVEYSDLAEGFVTGRGIQTSAQFGGTAAYDIDDAVEVRAGVEASRSYPGWSLALRGGVYTEHAAAPGMTSFSGDTSALTGQSAALERAGYHAPADTEAHLTLGAGARFYRWSFDLAADLSDPATRVILSATWSRR